MLYGAGGLVAIMHRHRNLLYSSTGAHHDINSFAMGERYHGIERIAQRKPRNGQGCNADGQLVEFSTLKNMHHFIIYAAFVYVNQRKPGEGETPLRLNAKTRHQKPWAGSSCQLLRS